MPQVDQQEKMLKGRLRRVLVVVHHLGQRSSLYIRH
uniref:Uncharacterized protein n=1 Tax=Picea glauca TaxID=3330 RepID=A0A124GP54_PICGL|nr:hypothetical protein ABT39_MTgene762 [Picea glauca]QHR90480.1 hypothetical protein Q903MT_gene4504 [Picea sitchensis]